MLPNVPRSSRQRARTAIAFGPRPDTSNAASVGWEFAPRLSLRAWSLRDGDQFEQTFAAPYPGGPIPTSSVTERFDRDVVWLTWDAPTRFDVLLRGGMLEGNVRVPLGARYALTVGSYRRRDATSALSFGLVAR